MATRVAAVAIRAVLAAGCSDVSEVPHTSSGDLGSRILHLTNGTSVPLA